MNDKKTTYLCGYQVGIGDKLTMKAHVVHTYHITITAFTTTTIDFITDDGIKMHIAKKCINSVILKE